MTRGWLVVILVGAATAALKATGPVLLGGRPVPPRLRPVLQLMAPAVFAALLVTQVFASGQRLTVDARLAGLVVAAVAAYWRAPAVAVLAAAAAATAAVRGFLR
jgi:branched-subunit amino acid transport protein